MRIVFIGTVEFSRLALKKLIEINANIVGVCTKDKSNFNSDYADLSPLCRENNIPCRLVEDINSPDSIEWIQELQPDIVFCFGWSSLIKSKLLSLPSMGIVGFHPAALPKNRGRHPLIWALALGLSETASTFFFMQEGADDGDILSQKVIGISHADYAADLYSKVVDAALAQIEEFVPTLQTNTYTRIPQNASLANEWRKRNQLDGLIDFRMSSNAIFNLIKALSKPYIGAHISYQGRDVKVWRSEEILFEEKNLEPGLVLCDKDGLLVKTYDGAIRIIEHEFCSLPSKGSYL